MTLNRIFRLRAAVPALLAALAVSACEWGFLGPSEDAGPVDTPDAVDGREDVQADGDGGDGDQVDGDGQDTDGQEPEAGDPDGPDPDVSDPDGPDPDAGDPDAQDPEVVEPELPACGNGAVEAGEECDDASLFCISCALTAPSGWTMCTDGAGRKLFFTIDTTAGAVTWQQARDRCKTTIDGMAPVGFRSYGLAVFEEEAVFTCVTASLDHASMYYIGLYQDTTASDYNEPMDPESAWYWTAWNGSAWTNLSSYSAAMTYLRPALNNAGGSGINVECGRMVWALTTWEFQDYSCADASNWLGICMVQF
jgi:hypothetical protein